MDPVLKCVQLSDDSTMTLKHNEVLNEKSATSNKTGGKKRVLCGRDKVITNVRQRCELSGDTIAL